MTRRLAPLAVGLLLLVMPLGLVAQAVGAGRAPGRDTAAGPRAAQFSGLRPRLIGPAMASGRIGDIVVDPTTQSTWYVGVHSGGVWKTVNAGTTWTPIFDSQASYSIGSVAIDPSNPLTVWVGTGENNSQRSVGFGDGVYKSTDGGRSWTNTGLKTSSHIGRILVKLGLRDRTQVAIYAYETGLVVPGPNRLPGSR